ncbi:MAG: hypothetical protein ACLVJH_16635 [Faecalibacterium prausnitzii]
MLDGWTGISGNNLASVLLRFDDDEPADGAGLSNHQPAAVQRLAAQCAQAS